MDQFYTIQGEGYHKGTAAFFIRIAGCDVGCHWCDVKESWDYQSHNIKSIDEIIFEAVKYSKLVVITGFPIAIGSVTPRGQPPSL